MRSLFRGLLLAIVGLGLACQPALAGGLKTDMTKALVPLDEIVPGGPQPDGIPAIDRPVFVGATYPGGRVLSRETGHRRSYGMNPYASYDRPESRPFLFRGQPDRRRPPKERVVGIVVGGSPRAYPWSILAAQGMIQDSVGEERVVILIPAGRGVRAR